MPISAPPAPHAYPLTRAQARLFFLHQLDPEAGSYLFPIHLRLRGPVDPAALDAALTGVVARHEILRSGIELRGEQPVQVVREHGPGLRQLDLRGLPEAERERREAAAVARECAEPFDFAATLMRSLLIRRADEDFVLLLGFHHIVFDGWSVGVLIRELGQDYRRRLGEPLPAPDRPALQYGEYAEREAAQPADALRPLEEYWRRTLTPVPANLRIPGDRPRPAALSGRAGRVAVILDAALTADLESCARRHRATIYMLLLAGYQVLLGRLSGQSDFCVGGGASGRHDPQTHAMIGTLVNELVYRCEYDPRANYTETIDRVRRRALEVYRHDRLPFERLVEVVAPVRSLSHHPLFQYAVTLQPGAGPGLELPGVEVTGYDSGAEGSALDAATSFHREGDRLVCVVDYSADLWDRPRGEAFAADLVAILRQIIIDPDQPVGRIALRGVALGDAAGTRAASSAADPSAALADPAGAAPSATVPAAVDGAAYDQAVAVLLGIWQEILGTDGLGPDQNFFDVGGDSLLGLRMVASVRKAGYPMRPRHIFLGQTAAALAAVLLAQDGAQPGPGPAEAGRAGGPGAEAPDGPVPLLPIQSWFLAGPDPEAGHYNYSTVFTVADDVDADQLSAALDAALAHHDAFRLRFQRRPAGSWRQSYGQGPPPGLLRRFDFSGLAPQRARAALDRATRACQAALGLTDGGPLVGCALFTLPGGRRELLVAAHHLIMEPASMGILADDVATACAQAARGEPVDLLPQHSTYQDWGRALQQLAQAPQIRAEADYWRQVAGSASNRIRVDRPQGRNDVASQATLGAGLDRAATRALRTEVAAATGATLTEMVLAGAGAALRPLTGGAPLLADFEMHGREDLVDAIDLTRTVGWFAALFPVLIPAPDADPAAHLERTAAGLREVPRGGLGHGLLTFLSGQLPHRRNHVGVTYLGTAVGGARAGAPLNFARYAEHDRAPAMTRPHELEIGAITVDDELAFSVTYSGNRYDESRIEEMLAQMRGYFESLIAAVARPTRAGR